MIGQIDLFADQAEHQRVKRTLVVDAPASRHTDPRTSHQAEARLRKSGELGAQQRLVLEAVKRWPGKTAVELAALIAQDHSIERDSAQGMRLRFTVSRRIPELIKADLVRRGRPRECTVNRSSQNIYYAVERGQA